MWYGGAEFSYCVNLKSGKRIRVGEVMESAYNSLHLRWSVLLCSVGPSRHRTLSGSHAVQIPEPMLMRQLQPYLEPLHRELIDTMPRHHLHNIAWIARTDGEEWTEKRRLIFSSVSGAYNKVEYAECMN